MRLLFVPALLAAAPVLPAAQDAPALGYALEPAAFPPTSSLAASTTLASGAFLVFDGLEVAHYESDGTLLGSLGTLPTQVFPSFLVADPAEQFVCVGESTNGKIYRLPLGPGGSPLLLATLPFNYDGALFEDILYVSAATCGFFCGNEIWRIDLARQQVTLLARVPGASGPLVTTPQGELLYASVSDSFPPPPGHVSIWEWSRAEAEGSQLLGLSDARLVGGGYEGASRLAYDPKQRALYLAEVNYATGENRVLQVGGSAHQSSVLIEGQTNFATGSLSFHRASGPARFLPFQPDAGGVLTYTTTDFFTPPERIHLRPRRPQATLTMPAVGQMRMRLSGGPPNGFAQLVSGPRALVPAGEVAFFLPSLHRLRGPAQDSLPFFLGLDLGSDTALPGLFSLSASGDLRLLAPDPGGTAADLAIQFVVFDAQLRLVATSTVAML